MGKPFSDLEKRALAILANGGNPASSQDQELAKYWAWRINPSANTHNLPEASSRTVGRKLDDYAINPFGIDLATSTFARVTMSKRSATFATGSIKAALEIQDITNTTTAYRLARFTPARVYARTGASTASEPRTSRITGRSYKSYYAAADQGYSMPFGQSVDTDTLRTRQEVITQAIKAADTTINLITFSPEKARP